ncbi:hypothetical protein [Pectinatus haikarae]|uniref:Uncharacterized protein n=1 Tax=Pectinatus haikarae TaxID=349096 RepID=A0ABT9Y844_9FIRM|nr:hypothetical protein [Pectinatus haikarae]MDQ0203367.1 hypothetical protein [Pectinatus haikarae]
MIKFNLKRLSVFIISAVMFTGIAGGAVANASPQDHYPQNRIQQLSPHNQKPAPHKKYHKAKHHKQHHEKHDRKTQHYR